VTLHEPITPQPAVHDSLDTEVIVVAAPSPVFVDSTGRRRKVLRRIAYAFGGLCMLYGGLICVSLAGGPVSSSAILPLPDLAEHDVKAAVTPKPTPTSKASAPARPQLITQVQTKRTTSAAREEKVLVPKAPPVIPAPTKPSVVKTTSAPPLESTKTPSVSPSPSPSPKPSSEQPSEGVAPSPPGTGKGGAEAPGLSGTKSSLAGPSSTGTASDGTAVAEVSESSAGFMDEPADRAPDQAGEQA
jgi:hypothetical protein